MFVPRLATGSRWPEGFAVRLPLIGGAYSARSEIANAQRSINYFPEINRQDAPSPFTLYQRPGLRPLVSPAVAAPCRGIWQASNGNGYCCIGQTVYSVDGAFALTSLGTLVTAGTTPVYATDNGTTALVVDGSPYGYSIDLATNAFAQVSDPTSTFTGATRVDTIDGFIVWNIPGTKQFGSTLNNELTFDALYVAGKSGYPDPLQGLIVNRREIILLGTATSEIWYDAGNTGFPFAELPGTFIQHGAVSPYSIAFQDIEVFWLEKDLQGKGIVLALKGYDTRRISNHAVEYAIGQMSDISDAIGYTYQQDGHTFYVLTFPTGNQTWVYDASLGDHPDMAWHQRAWTNPADGSYNRVRERCAAVLYGKNVVGDHTTGTLYQLDPTYFYDNVSGVDNPITFLRSFPHNFGGTNFAAESPMQQGQQTSSDNKQILYRNFMADMEVGKVATDSQSIEQQVTLRWSNDRGVTFQTGVLESNGAPGQYQTVPTWRTIGLARDMVFELSHSIPGPAALQGAWVDTTLTNQ